MARVSQPALREIWKGPLVAGLCFGVAYGVTQRLLSFNVSELIRFGPGFDVQVFPGTSLESLRLRFGDADAEIRGDLELQELERQQQQDAKQRAEAAKQAEAVLKRSEAMEPQEEPPAEPQLPAPSAPAPLPPAVPPPTAPAAPL
jgi:hypothetical protein